MPGPVLGSGNKTMNQIEMASAVKDVSVVEKKNKDTS
jgi:hypothetical protein